MHRLFAEKLLRRDRQLSSLVDYIRESNAGHLAGYDGDDVDQIIWLLRHAPGSIGITSNSFMRGTNATTNLTDALKPLSQLPPFFDARSRHDELGMSGDASNGTTLIESEINTTWLPETGIGAVNHGANKHFPLSHDEVDSMGDLAHGLHFASIGMLGFLVLEVR